MKNLGIIIQARLGSSRLPNKILKPFQSGTILSFLIDKLSTLNIPIIIATTTSSKDDKLVDYLIEKEYNYFRGDEVDVLSRYIGAAKMYNLENIIRITSDNPFLDLKKLKELILIFKNNQNYDYWSFKINDKPIVLSHLGIFAEIVKLNALINLKLQFNISEYNEHVTYGIYTNPNKFRIYFKDKTDVFNKYENIRLTVDTIEDYKNILIIENKFKELSFINFNEIGDYILTNNELTCSMEQIINNNCK